MAEPITDLPVERDETDVLGASPTEEKLTTAAPVEVASKPEPVLSELNKRMSDRYSATRDVDKQNLKDRAYSDSEAEYISAVKTKEAATQKAVEQQQAAVDNEAELAGVDSEILALQEKINFIEEQGGSSAASREELNKLLIKKESLSPPKVEVEQKSTTDIIEDGTSDKQHSMDRIVAANAAEVEQQKAINTEQQRLDTMDRFRNKELEAVQKENDKSKATIKAERAKLDSEDLQIKEESKETFWGSLSIPEKILAGISLFIGGAGGRNYAAETFNNHVKNFAEEKGKANKNVALARKQAYERINLELDLMTKRTNNVVKIEKIKMLQESNRIEIAKAQKEREDAARAANTRKDLFINGATPEEAKMMDVKDAERGIALKQPDGSTRVQFGNSKAGVAKLKERVISTNIALDGISKLEEIASHSAGGSFSLEDRAAAKSIQQSLVGALRLELFGPGVLTEVEQEIAREIIGNPATFMSITKLQLVRLKTLGNKVRYSTRSALRLEGINIPASNNDKNIAKVMQEIAKSKGIDITNPKQMKKGSSNWKRLKKDAMGVMNRKNLWEDEGAF